MPTDLVETRPNISALAREHGVSRQTMRRRLANGWQPPVTIEGEIIPPNQSVATPAIPDGHPPGHHGNRLGRGWHAVGRAGVGLAIVSTGAFIAFTSMRANSWFGRSLTPDPVAGEVYSHLSVAAEVVACLIPTGIRFYWTNGEAWTAVRGWALMVVALVVVFFAAGGFAITNINSGIEARAERQTADVLLAQRKLDTLTKSRDAECRRRGPECRRLEHEEQDAIAALTVAQAGVKAGADPQAVALGVSSPTLHLVQAGSMVALCLFSGLFISFGAGLIWPREKNSGL